VLDADVLVIGSGAGGATVAAELAEAGYEVVVLEEGSYYQTHDFTADTTNNQIIIGTSGSLDGKLVFSSAGSVNTVTISPTSLTANRTLTLPNVSGTICTDSGNCAGAGSTVQTAYNNSVGGTTPKIKLNSTLQGFDVQDADVTTGADLFNVRASNGAGLGSVMLGVGNTGAVTLQNSADSLLAFNVMTQGGTNVLRVDTTNGQTILGKSSVLAGNLVFHNASNANAITLTSAVASAGQTVTLPDATGTVCLQGAAACGFATSTQCDHPN
jgi:hypothetical protein